MMRRSPSRRSFQVALTCWLLAGPCCAAFAADPVPEEDTRKIRKSREVLLQEGLEQPLRRSWLGPNFQIHDKMGLQYVRRLDVGDGPLVIRLGGPMLRKQNALGLQFKLNF